MLQNESRANEINNPIYGIINSTGLSITDHGDLKYDGILEKITYGLLIEEEKIRYAEKAGIKRILLIADDKSDLRTLTGYLGSGNYSVAAANNGMEALEKINAGNFDLILLDIAMPEMSGFEVCQRIRRNYKLYELPVIMLTARNNIPDIAEGFNAGANDYIVKPFYQEELLSRINTLVKLKETVEQIEELKNNIEIIVSNMPEGVLLFNPGLEIRYANDRFKEFFNMPGGSIGTNLPELFDKEICDIINGFVYEKRDKLIFEWIIGDKSSPILIEIILKYINKEFVLMIVSEIKDVLAEKELETCYYIIHGYSERETAKLLYRSRTTVNSNKARAREKLKLSNYLTLIEKLK